MENELVEFVEYLTLTKGLMYRTINHYIGYYKLMNHSIPFNQEYCNKFLQDHKNHTVVRGMMLNLLAFRKLNKIIDMPPKKTGSPSKRVARGVTKADIDKLTTYLYDKEFKMGLIFELVYQGALRRSEVPTIRINSFKWLDWLTDINKPCLLIVLGKRDKERVVLINPETAEKLLNTYRQKYKLDTLDKIETFANSESLIFKKLTEKDIYNYIKRGSKKCLGKDIRPHELRHARATELEKMGVPVKDIKVYLGHSTLATTEIYLHTSEKESIENIQKIMEKK